MKSLLPFNALAACTVIFSSCSSSLSESKYNRFKARSDYRKTYEVYRDESLLKTANSSNTRVKIDLSDQRAQLLVGEQVALDLPCSTGKPGKRTPAGNFKITRKIVNKRSNIFGSLYRGSRKVYGGDRRKYRGRYTRYVGSPLPYWMRITDNGIGMHYSRGVRRHACSNGCIRMPKEAVRTIYAKTRVGTPVQITH